MNRYLLLLVIINVNCIEIPQICPFPVCKPKYDNKGYCTNINCVSSNGSFPVKGLPTVKFVEEISFKNIRFIPDDSFDDLEITSLKMYGRNLINISTNAFRDIKKLVNLEMFYFKYPLLITQTKHLTYLSNSTSLFNIHFSVFNISVVKLILNEVKVLNSLNHLGFYGNNFSCLIFDFSEFKNLQVLHLSNNFLEYFNLKSGTITHLSVSKNEIQAINSQMFENLKNLEHLTLSYNQITKLTNNVFANLTKLKSLDLSYNKIFEIEENSFLGINLNLSTLSLSFNPIKNIKLRHLNYVKNLYLKGINYSVAEPEYLGVQNVSYIDLSENQIGNFSNNFYKIIINSVWIILADNLIENLTFLSQAVYTELNNLFLSNNRIETLGREDFLNMPNLYYLDISNNRIKQIEYPEMKNLKIIYLNHNCLSQIEKNTFKNLVSLNHLHLSNNLIEKIHPRAFDNNKNLNTINLANNLLSVVPDVSKLSALNKFNLSNQNGRLISLHNNAFERELSLQDVDSNLSIDLSDNIITKFFSKTFCSQYSKFLAHGLFELVLGDINRMDACMLKQFNNTENISFYIKNAVMCQIKAIARLLSLQILNKNNNSCNYADIRDECSNSSKEIFICPKKSKYLRYTTWALGDSHFYTYKTNYEICSIKKESICLETDYFVIHCTQSKENFLREIKFIYWYKNLYFTLYANETNFPDQLDNGERVAIDELTGGLKLIEINKISSDSILIYHYETKTHIFLLRFQSFYALLVRGTHKFYSKSNGILLDGCNGRKLPPNVLDFKNTSQECNQKCLNITKYLTELELELKIANYICHKFCQANSSYISLLNKTIEAFRVLEKTDNLTSSRLNFTRTTKESTRFYINSTEKINLKNFSIFEEEENSSLFGNLSEITDFSFNLSSNADYEFTEGLFMTPFSSHYKTKPQFMNTKSFRLNITTLDSNSTVFYEFNSTNMKNYTLNSSLDLNTSNFRQNQSNISSDLFNLVNTTFNQVDISVTNKENVTSKYESIFLTTRENLASKVSQ